MFEGEGAALPDTAVLDPCAAALREAVDRLLAQDVAGLPESVALTRAREVQRQIERLEAVRARALVDVDRRELFALDDAGSTRSWLRQQKAQSGLLTRARQLLVRPRVEDALAAGTVTADAAVLLCRALDRLPEQIADDQLLGVLAHGVPDLLSAWTGRLVSPALVGEELLGRRERLASVLRACSELTAAGPDAQLEPAFVLLAQALTPAELPHALRMLTDALLPDALDDRQAADHDETFWRLRKAAVGWDLHAHLDDELGQQLHADLQARLRRPKVDEELAAAAADDAPATAGAGSPFVSEARALTDALRSLLADAASVPPGSGQPRPAQLLISTTLENLEGRAGVLPGTLAGPGLPTPIGREAIRRIGCSSRLTVALFDAAGRPIGISGSHRHATDRERFALSLTWGGQCAIAGCSTTIGLVPHHVEPWWLSHRTVLEDLIPICTHHHHDVHEGQRTLQLRDARVIGPRGWVQHAVAA